MTEWAPELAAGSARPDIPPPGGKGAAADLDRVSPRRPVVPLQPNGHMMNVNGPVLERPRRSASD